VGVCLRVQPEEKVCVITDETTLEIAAAIVAELEKLGRATASGCWKIWRSVR
jgi:leucyl aminopeptidase (aminopeptidase T)